MTDINTLDLETILNDCLTLLETDMQIEDILERYPEHKDELRPLLETASRAKEGAEIGVPVQAMNRSRTRMLVRAEQLRRAKKRPLLGRISFRRLALQVLGVLVVLGASLTSLFAASAQTLPGDSLYRIKILSEEARLSAARPDVIPDLKETFRARRIDEIRQLIELGRAVPISFEGVVTQIEGGVWQIGGLDVSVSPETKIVGEILIGMFVEVEGQTLSTGEIRAVNIYLRAYAFAGIVEAINGQIWVINDVPVLVQAETQLAPGITPGMQVVVLAQMDDEGTISARAILLADSTLGSGEMPGEALPQATDTPESTPSPTVVTVTPSPETGDDDDSTPEPGETEEDDGEDETEEPEDEEPEETEEPDDDSSNSGSGSSSEKTEEPDDD